MDTIFDLITLPFELITGSIECLFSCFFLIMASMCCLSMVLLFSIA